MRLWSDSWVNGECIPARFAAGQSTADGAAAFANNLNPHLAWGEVRADVARVDFFHWVLVDLPATLMQIDEGVFSRGFTTHGKPGPAVDVAGTRSARQDLNDCTGWFAGEPTMAGNHFGYDGPYPPFNDSLVHHHGFTVYALGIARVPVEGHFSVAQVREAIDPHILSEATHSGTYTLNRRLR
jgi:phosphatidylethanolamine-binding protein (PEBP) family uncharacterized protein